MLSCSLCAITVCIHVFQGPNFSPSPSFLFQSPISEKFKDLSINWSSSTRSNQISYQPPSCLDPSVLQFDFRNRGGNNEFSQPASKERVTACTMEKKRGMNDMIGKLMSENSKHYRVSPFPNVNVYHPLISLKEGPCGTQLAFPVPITTPIEKTGHSRLDGSNLWHTRNSSPLSRLHNDLNGGADSPFKSKSRNVMAHLETPGKYQVVPRFWPKVSYKNQVLQNQSKEYPSSLIDTTLEYNFVCLPEAYESCFFSYFCVLLLLLLVCRSSF